MTIRRDELRDAFDIGRLTPAQSEAVCEALGRQGVFVFPAPVQNGHTLRLYDQRHPIAGLAEAVTKPDAIPETALRRAAEVFAREHAGRELRSDDAPWLTVFDVFLQIALGREPDGWEELRDDRHPTELARELAVALGFTADVASRPSTLRLSAAVCAFRTRTKAWLASDLAAPDDTEAAVLPLIDALAAAGRRVRDDHDRLLRQAARLLLRSDEIPSRPVELGMLGLRYRRESAERTT
jgi:hypothetical protein